MKDKPNWKKGDIIVRLNHHCGGGVLSIFEANQDPWYGKPFFSSTENWYYGLRNCKEIRPATLEDIDHKIQIQKEKIEREQTWLDELVNFREILENK